MANWAGYSAIRAEARRLCWPESYKQDLSKYDRAILAKKDAPQFFGWSIRQTGTDFYQPNSLGAVYWAEAQRKSWGPTQRYYWYDGEQLLSVSLDQLIQRLIQTLDIDSFRGRLRAANAQLEKVWKRFYSTTTEQLAYLKAEAERNQAEQDCQEVLRLQTSVESE